MRETKSAPSRRCQTSSHVSSFHCPLSPPRTRVMNHLGHRNYSRPIINSLSSPNHDSTFPTNHAHQQPPFSDTNAPPLHPPLPVRTLLPYRPYLATLNPVVPGLQTIQERTSRPGSTTVPAAALLGLVLDPCPTTSSRLYHIPGLDSHLGLSALDRHICFLWPRHSALAAFPELPASRSR